MPLSVFIPCSSAAQNFHSYRSAITGSIRAARRAGIKLATNATTTNNTAIATKVAGSVALTPDSNLFITRVSANARPTQAPRHSKPKPADAEGPATNIPLPEPPALAESRPPESAAPPNTRLHQASPRIALKDSKAVAHHGRNTMRGTAPVEHLARRGTYDKALGWGRAGPGNNGGE